MVSATDGQATRLDTMWSTCVFDCTYDRLRGRFRALLSVPSLEAMEEHFGEYAGLAAVLVGSAPSLQGLPVAETPAFLDSHRIAARGVWAPGDADLRTWMHQVKPTSFSLWIEGAVDVLAVHRSFL